MSSQHKYCISHQETSHHKQVHKKKNPKKHIVKAEMVMKLAIFNKKNTV